MNRLFREEERQRLKGLLRGPWAARANYAIQLLDPGTPFLERARGVEALSPKALWQELPKRLRAKEATFRAALTPHWKSGGEYDDEQAEFRDSLDEALTEVQLLELAVETGYLSTDVVCARARRTLLQLLWSPSVRRYIQDYDYVAVGLLAERVGVQLDEQSNISAPAQISGAQVRFAQFLQLLYSWYDSDIDEWLGTLDGYGLVDDDDEDYWEPQALYELFDDETLPDGCTLNDVERYFQLVRGAYGFIRSLSEFFSLVREGEAVRYGIFFQYWLAKFFGYSRGARGYRLGNGEFDWAGIIQSNPSPIAYALGGTALVHSDDYQKFRVRLRRELGVVRKIWRDVRLALKPQRRS